MLSIVPHTVPRVARSYEHFANGFELHILQLGSEEEHACAPDMMYTATMSRPILTGVPRS